MENVINLNEKIEDKEQLQIDEKMVRMIAKKTIKSLRNYQYLNDADEIVKCIEARLGVKTKA